MPIHTTEQGWVLETAATGYALGLNQAGLLVHRYWGARLMTPGDYAVLADFVLKKHGLDTRLIHIRLAGRVAHAVCYVTENKAYLDYNNRAVFFTLARSGSDLRDIAAKVAHSLDSNWTSASEFSYSYDTRRKTMITTIAQIGAGPDNVAKPSAFNVN